MTDQQFHQGEFVNSYFENFSKEAADRMRYLIAQADERFDLLAVEREFPGFIRMILVSWRERQESPHDHRKEIRRLFLRVLLKYSASITGVLVGVLLGVGGGAIPQSPLICFVVLSASLTHMIFLTFLDDDTTALASLVMGEPVPAAISDEWAEIFEFAKKDVLLLLERRLMVLNLAADGSESSGVQSQSPPSSQTDRSNSQ